MSPFTRPRRLRSHAWIVLSTALIGTLAWRPARADEFSRLVGPSLFEIPRRPEGKGVPALSIRAIEAMPEVLSGERSAFLVVETDEGNVAKLLVSPALRPRPAVEGQSERQVVPILSLDRFETIDRGDRVARKARGRDVVLFDGFDFDLDSGQVVPPGFGGDIRFESKAKGGPALVGLGTSRLYPIDRPIRMAGIETGRPSTGLKVLPTDFNGRYTLVANGQLAGALELSIGEDGTVSGQFRSDRNGGQYPVTGKIAADRARRIEFEIRFPRSRQSFDGLLWTEERNVFAGTTRLLEHEYSFLAVREGFPIYPDPIEGTAPPRPPSVAKTTTLVVGIAGDRYTLDGVENSADEMSRALTAAISSRSASEALIRVPPSTPFEKVQALVRLIRRSGIETIRFGDVKEP